MTMISTKEILNEPKILDEEVQMGAVRVKVKLTGVFEQELVSRGSLHPKYLRTYEAVGLVDTGALTLVIPQTVVDYLGLKIRKQQEARFANGQQEVLGVTEPVEIECQGRTAAVEALVVGDEILIGQVVLELMDFLVDCNNQQLIPNPKNPDYPVAMI
jgi:clan AA aspartic protease